MWWECMSQAKLEGALPQNPKQHFLQHINGMVNGIRIKRWRCWWLALTQSIWHHRNKTIFSNEAFNGNKVMDDASFLLWTWLTSFEKDFDTNYNHWSSNLRSGFLYQLRIAQQINSRKQFHLCIQTLVPIKTTSSLILEPYV